MPSQLVIDGHTANVSDHVFFFAPFVVRHTSLDLREEAYVSVVVVGLISALAMLPGRS